MVVGQQVTRASPTNKASVAGTFAGETPAQIAKHREIARRHRRHGKADGAAFFPRLRISELERIFFMQYHGKRLPDDDAGRADLRLMADHLAQIDPRRIRPWAVQWIPTITPAEVDALIASVGTGKRWKADALARELGLDDATRTRLQIKTIGATDCGKAKRKTRRRRKRNAANRARRAKAGARPHVQSTERAAPWIEMGISRATYYRRRAQEKAVHETVETETRPIVRSTYTEKNSCLSSLNPGWKQGAEASPFTGEPLSSLSFRVRQPCEQATVDPIAGLDNVAFRAAHLEHFKLLSVMPLSLEQKARLTELNEILETERQRRALRRSLMATFGAERSNLRQCQYQA